MSFRSRSARGSAGSNANNTLKVKSEEADGGKSQPIRRQRTLLSQTSWRSVTFIPNLMRSLSTSRSPDSSRQTSREERETDCGLCGCWSPGEDHPQHDDEEYCDEVVRERPEEIREEDEEQVKEEEEAMRDEEKQEEIVAEDSEAENVV